MNRNIVISWNAKKAEEERRMGISFCTPLGETAEQRMRRWQVTDSHYIKCKELGVCSPATSALEQMRSLSWATGPRGGATAWDQNSVLEVVKDWNGIDQVVLRVPRGASARVSLHGGQVVSWKNERGEELLFTSSKAIFKPPKAMRGGIPICFPQFGNSGSLEQHGFARNKMWSIDYDPPPLRNDDDKEKVSVDLLLKPSEDDLKCWPHCYEFRLRVSLATNGVLTMISRVRNINGKPFSFSFAYHTYLSVSDISEVRIEGLETLDYLDNLCQRKRFTEQGDAVTFESEVDRIYLGSPNVIAVLDHEKKRTFLIKKKGLPDVVVWNPWEKKSKSITDLGDEEYKQMLCVDGAVVERPITLKPGEEWTGRLDISSIPSTHFI